jgi:hypothetical protein
MDSHKQAALESQKKYRAKKKYCEICDMTVGIKNFTRHLQSNDHKLKNVLYDNLPNKWRLLLKPNQRSWGH